MLKALNPFTYFSRLCKIIRFTFNYFSHKRSCLIQYALELNNECLRKLFEGLKSFPWKNKMRETIKLLNGLILFLISFFHSFISILLCYSIMRQGVDSICIGQARTLLLLFLFIFFLLTNDFFLHTLWITLE
jgi:hypothetical protein